MTRPLWRETRLWVVLLAAAVSCGAAFVTFITWSDGSLLGRAVSVVAGLGAISALIFAGVSLRATWRARRAERELDAELRREAS